MRKRMSGLVIGPASLESPTDPMHERKYCNNPDGPVMKPGYYTDPEHRDYTPTPAAPGRKYSFSRKISNGESPFDEGPATHTPSGVSHSRGRNANAQYNWGKGDSGEWNDNDFDGGNMTGM